MDRKRWTLLAVGLATFMTYLDNNIVNVAIPAIQRDLGLSVTGLEWVVSGYILVFASLLLAGGRLADVYGRRRVFTIGLVIFTAASLAAGVAGSVDVLVAARVVQGLGAALLTPTTLAIISATFTQPKERAAAVGLWSAVGALALAVGPLLGGIITDHLSWGWIFFINVPAGIITIALGLWAIEESREDRAPKSLDVPGLSTSVIALFALTYALIEGPNRGWTSGLILGAFAAFAVFAIAFVIIESRASEPMVNVSVFHSRVFSGGSIAIVMWGFGLFGIYFFTSLYLQNVLGFSPTKSGAAFVPMALLMAIGAVVSEPAARRFGAHRTVGFAMLIMGIGIAMVSLLGQHASYLDLMPSFALIGIGGGLSVTLTAMILETMPGDQAGVASGIFNAAREVSGLLGITVIGAIVSARESSRLRVGDTPVDAFLSGYRLGLVVAAVLVAAGGVAAWIALRGTRPVSQDPTAAEAGDEDLAETQLTAAA